MSAFVPPTVQEFKDFFSRDFKYGDGVQFVRSADVSKSILEARIDFNPSLWDAEEGQIAYLYAAAHFLVLDIQAAGGLASSKGLNSRGGGITQSKSVGQVSVSYQPSQQIVDSPVLSQFLRTDYGVRYLQFITPRLIGNISIAFGGVPIDTLPL